MFEKSNGLDFLIENHTSDTVLWLPTFRNNISGSMNNSIVDYPLLTDTNINDFNQKISELGIILVIKLHPLQRQIDFLNNKNWSNIHIVDNDWFFEHDFEFYNFIGEFDALLTDYSSVAFDYMLLDRPIGYVIDDYDEYNQKRGFNMDDPLELMPGMHIYTYDDLIAFFQNLKDKKDLYVNERNKVNRLINLYHDNKNCERIIHLLLGKNQFNHVI